MKILYAIHQPGNLSSAEEIYTELSRYGQVDVLVSASETGAGFSFPVKYRVHGFSLRSGKDGGLALRKTLAGLRPLRFLVDVLRVPVRSYDLVIHDFEPVTAWACRLKMVGSVALGHRCSLSYVAVPLPARQGRFVKKFMANYAPSSSSYGIHFRSYSPSIFTPVIHKDIRNAGPVAGNHYTVYLPDCDEDTLVRYFSYFNETEWHIFSAARKEPYQAGNHIRLLPTERRELIRSIAGSAGVISDASFDITAAAEYLGKKLLVMPSPVDYEQQCNAISLYYLGVPVIKKLSRRYYDTIHYWIRITRNTEVTYPDQTPQLITQIIRDHTDLKLNPQT